jgi:hypothetical protein
MGRKLSPQSGQAVSGTRGNEGKRNYGEEIMEGSLGGNPAFLVLLLKFFFFGPRRCLRRNLPFLPGLYRIFIKYSINEFGDEPHSLNRGRGWMNGKLSEHLTFSIFLFIVVIGIGMRFFAGPPVRNSLEYGQP